MVSKGFFLFSCVLATVTGTYQLFNIEYHFKSRYYLTYIPLGTFDGKKNGEISNHEIKPVDLISKNESFNLTNKVDWWIGEDMG